MRYFILLYGLFIFGAIEHLVNLHRTHLRQTPHPSFGDRAETP